MGCDSKLIAIIVAIILVCGGSGAYSWFQVVKDFPNDEPPKYAYLHWYFYHNWEMPDEMDRLAWYASYGEALEGFRWQLVGFMNALALLFTIFFTYCLKNYVGLNSCLSFLLAFISGGLYAGAYTVYYLGVQNLLDLKEQMIGVEISVGLGLAADFFGVLVFFFMIFGCICGCCKKDEEAYKAPTSKDYGANLAV